MKRRLIILIILISVLITCSCATQEYAATYRKQKSLMLLDNTDLGRNSKYYKQKHTRYNKSNYNKHIKKFKK